MVLKGVLSFTIMQGFVSIFVVVVYMVIWMGPDEGEGKGGKERACLNWRVGL